MLNLEFVSSSARTFSQSLDDVAECMESMNPKLNPVMEPMVAPNMVFRKGDVS